MNRSKIKPIQSMTNKAPQYCEICDTTIKGNSYKFKCHLYKHKLIKPRFECSHCFKQFFRRDLYKAHERIHTGKSVDRKSYVCDYCDRSFLSKPNLVNHLKIHDDSLQQRRDLQFKCMACGVTYCEARLLRNHIRKTHYSFQVKEEQHLKKTLNETWVENVKDSKVCVEMTKVNNNVITIRKCVKQEGKLIKESKIQDFSSNTSNYSKVSHYSKVICDYCKKEMLKKSLITHIRETHFDFRKFQCEECKRQFHRHYQMANHVCGKKARRKIYRALAKKESDKDTP